MLQSCSLYDVFESVITSLSDKNPNVVRFTSGFIDEGIKVTFIDELMIFYKDLIPPLIKLTDHSESAV